ncbi:MAG: ATP-dependent RecD-like DNA helicase [Fibrobacter sp.]|jgi:exodeoxyribonuclease V alpha subunit|nr:ATP-dependent RecD-like DNA helicase [Fibrobacter sp.]
MQIEATVKRVTYQNPENQFSVLRVQVNGEKSLTTVTGYMPLIHVGESALFKGAWSFHPKYGNQFVCDSVEILKSDGREGVISYLSSGLFPGVGVKTAERLVDRFGDLTLEVFDSEPDRLYGAVRGFSKKKVDAFLKVWRDLKEARQVHLFLYSHQITGSVAKKIYLHYGADAIRVITENPFVLCDEVWGIGFVKADEIAQKLGIAKDHYMRIRAGLIYALSFSSVSNGHVFLPRSVLLEKTLSVLRVELNDTEFMERIVFSLDELIQTKTLILEDENLWMPLLHKAETYMAAWVRDRLSVPKSPLKEKWRQELRVFEAKNDLDLDPVQFQGVCQAFEHRLCVITGGPGTGKTTMLQGIIHLASVLKEKVLLAAPTGRAARRMQELCGVEAQTIHKLLEVDPASGAFLKNDWNHLDADFVVIDEFSMVDTWLAYSLMKAIPPKARVLFVGDKDQLPSVGPGNVLRDLLLVPHLPAVYLTKVFRQADGSDIAEKASRVNQGLMPSPLEGTHFHFSTFESPDEAKELLKKIVSEELPRLLDVNLVQDLQVLTPMRKGPLGLFELNRFLQDFLNGDSSGFSMFGVDWRVSDRVMQLKNNYDKNIFNGDIGFVSKIHKSSKEISVEFDARTIRLDAQELDQMNLAYACTIHKSQGSEYPAVIIVLDHSHYMMLQRNLIYTAITRAKGHVWVLSAPGAFHTAVKNNRSIHRYTMLAQWIQHKE